jgi:hypothetical protein
MRSPYSLSVPLSECLSLFKFYSNIYEITFLSVCVYLCTPHFFRFLRSLCLIK